MAHRWHVEIADTQGNELHAADCDTSWQAEVTRWIKRRYGPMYNIHVHQYFPPHRPRHRQPDRGNPVVGTHHVQAGVKLRDGGYCLQPTVVVRVSTAGGQQ